LSQILVATVDELGVEYMQQPFVEITVRQLNCNDDEEVLFSHTWEGTEAGCYHNSLHTEDWVDTVSENNAYNNRVPKNAQRSCYPILSRNEVVEDTFFGQKVCGRRGGDAYVLATRANSTGHCPDNKTACSNLTNAEDTICYLPEDLKMNCPVNALKFVRTTTNETTSGFSTQRFNA